jgi:anti-anti-sigma factor
VQVTTEQVSRTTVVRCDGRLNLVAAPGVKARLDQLVDDGATRLVVDLSRTAFIDSSGLGALVAGLKRARQAGGDLRIAAPTEQVRTVLGLTNLDRVLTPYDDVSAAADGW